MIVQNIYFFVHWIDLNLIIALITASFVDTSEQSIPINFSLRSTTKLSFDMSCLKCGSSRTKFIVSAMGGRYDNATKVGCMKHKQKCDGHFDLSSFEPSIAPKIDRQEPFALILPKINLPCFFFPQRKGNIYNLISLAHP